MNHPFAHRRPTELEDKAYGEVVRHFAAHSQQFPASRETIDRLERNIARLASTAGADTPKPARPENFIPPSDGTQWHRDAELMEIVSFCHRPITGGAEFAVAKHAPKTGTNEILHRGWNATEVLKAFTQQQRRALQLWTEDIQAQVGQFLAETFPG